uniref:DUF2254 family protein n=1 Tax=Roseobacter sp. TaxID=1907202 RepID=UPI0025D9F213
YSLASIILYQAGFYSDQAAIVVMGVTIVVVVLVVVSMLRWIQHLTDLGSVANSLHTATERARASLAAFAGDPALGGVRMREDAELPDGLTPLRAAEAGYIQLIDVPGLQKAFPEGTSVYVSCRPGTHVLKGEIIAQVAGNPDEEALENAAAAFTLGDTRSYEQDAVFGLIVLSEIASKALSPGINDAGTAIGTIQNLKTLLWDFSRQEPQVRDEFAETVFVAVPGNKTLITSAFSAVARDGAGMIEVARTLRQALADLAASPDPEMAQAAEEMAATALEHCQNATLLDSEYEKLNEISVPAPAMARPT